MKRSTTGFCRWASLAVLLLTNVALAGNGTPHPRPPVTVAQAGYLSLADMPPAVKEGDAMPAGDASASAEAAARGARSSFDAASTERISMTTGDAVEPSAAGKSEVPEADSSTMLLAGLGLMVCVGRRRRRPT